MGRSEAGFWRRDDAEWIHVQNHNASKCPKKSKEANKNGLRNFDGHAQAGHEMTDTLAAMACVWMVWAWQLAHMALLDERDDEF